MHFKFPFNLIGKSTMAFLVHTQILVDRGGRGGGGEGGKNKDFGIILQTGITSV